MLPIPESGEIKLFTIGGKHLANLTVQFSMAVVDVHVLPGIVPADDSCFDLIVIRNASTQADLVLTRSIAGPQVIELDFNIEINHGTAFAGSSITKLFIDVSQYGF